MRSGEFFAFECERLVDCNNGEFRMYGGISFLEITDSYVLRTSRTVVEFRRLEP